MSDDAGVAVGAEDRDRHGVVAAERDRQHPAGEDRADRGLDVVEAAAAVAVHHVDVAAVDDPDAVEVDLVELRVVVARRAHPVDRRRVADPARPEPGPGADLRAEVVRRADHGHVGVERGEVGRVRHLGERRDAREGQVHPFGHAAESTCGARPRSAHSSADPLRHHAEPDQAREDLAADTERESRLERRRHGDQPRQDPGRAGLVEPEREHDRGHRQRPRRSPARTASAGRAPVAARRRVGAPRRASRTARAASSAARRRRARGSRRRAAAAPTSRRRRRPPAPSRARRRPPGARRSRSPGSGR